MRRETIAGSDNVLITIARLEDEFSFQYHPPAPSENSLNIFIALRTHREFGTAVLPFARGVEGSTVFLPFQADLLLSAVTKDDEIVPFLRRWERWRWTEREQTKAFEVTKQDSEFVFRISRALVGNAPTVNFVIYAKDLNANDGWGWFWGCSDRTVDSGMGDKYVSHYHELRLDAEGPLVTARRRGGSADSRIRIYQLFVRLFGNTNETRQQTGTLAENGVGRFADINHAALRSIRDMGFTHIWLTGVLQQATATDYSEFGQPADDPDHALPLRCHTRIKNSPP